MYHPCLGQVREGLKKFSNWPTYPQVYVKGELVGGVDIVRVRDEESVVVDTYWLTGFAEALFILILGASREWGTQRCPVCNMRACCSLLYSCIQKMFCISRIKKVKYSPYNVVTLQCYFCGSSNVFISCDKVCRNNNPKILYSSV